MATTMWAGAREIHGSSPSSTYSGSWASSAIRRRVSASVTTTMRTPWLKPPLGAFRPRATIRSTASRSTGSSV